MRTIVLLGLAYLLPLSQVVADAKEPVVEALLDWEKESITLNATWQPGKELSSQSNAELRRRMREILLKKLSVVVGRLWERSKADEGERQGMPDLSNLWTSLRLATFQIAENRALATLEVSLRGRDSLMAQLPLDFGAELNSVTSAGSAAEYEKRAHMAEYDISDYEPLKYTGLIIDARHLPYVPSLNPGIYTSSGRQIYGAAFLNRGTAIRRGVTSFHETDKVPEAQRRAGKRPLRISAIDLQRAGESGLVISEEDAAKFLAHTESVRNLKRARVVILVNASALRERY